MSHGALTPGSSQKFAGGTLDISADTYGVQSKLDGSSEDTRHPRFFPSLFPACFLAHCKHNISTQGAVLTSLNPVRVRVLDLTQYDESNPRAQQDDPKVCPTFTSLPLCDHGT